MVVKSEVSHQNLKAYLEKKQNREEKTIQITIFFIW